MAKKTHSLKQFSAGYNSKVAPRDLKDEALAKSQGVTVERPGTLSLLGKSNHFYQAGENYSYSENNTSEDVLGDARDPVHEPGSGVYSFASEFSFGYIGLIDSISATTDAPNPHIRITANISTPVYDSSTGITSDSQIPIQAGDWIYIWGILNTSGMHHLNDRYYKVTSVGDSVIDLCDYYYGQNQITDSSKLSDLTTYNSGTHGGYFKTIPESNYTQYTITQNGECLDLHYNVLGSNNIFSKGTIPCGTLGLTSNSATGRIGRVGNDSQLDLGLDNNFAKWPQRNGINYGLKPSFFFGDDVLRYWASNRVMRHSDGDTQRYGNPRWFGYIHRQNLFGIDAGVTNINEWYLTDANLRPPAVCQNDTVNQFGNYVKGTIVDRVSWETGTLAFNTNKWATSGNQTWADTKRFSEDETVAASWHNMSGTVSWQAGRLDDLECEVDNITKLAQNRGRQRRGGDGFCLPTALYNRLADGDMLISQTDYGSAASNTTLEYWHAPGSGDFKANTNHVATSEVNGWTWNRENTDINASKRGSLTKVSGANEPLYVSMGTNATIAPLSDGETYILSFTLNDCTYDGSDSNLQIYLQNAASDEKVTVDTTSIDDYQRVKVKLMAGTPAAEEIDNWLIKFVPGHINWVGTISNVQLYKRRHGDSSVGIIWSTAHDVDTSGDDNGWDKTTYEIYQTFVYDGSGSQRQESCASLVKEINFASYTNKKSLRLCPAVHFSSDGLHYDMMDKRIIGSNIYYRRKWTDSGAISHDNIILLMEMDWVKGVRQWGEGTKKWIEWTQNVLESGEDDETAFYIDYTVNNKNWTLPVSHLENSTVMPKVSSKAPFFEWKNVPELSPTYSAHSGNGHKHNEAGVGNVRYGTMASVNGRKYVANFAVPSSLTSGTDWKDNSIVPTYDYYPTSIIRSSGSKDDMYCLDTDILRVSGISESKIIKMYGLSKYLVVLCIDSYYILDMSQAIPMLYANNSGQGIKHECQSAKTDLGIVWVNDKGCFIFGSSEQGYGIQNLIEGKISKDERGWVNNNFDSQLYSWEELGLRPNRNGLYFWDIKDTGDYIPTVGYDAVNRKILIKKSCKFTGNQDESHLYVYDIFTKTWTTNISGTTNDDFLDEDGNPEPYDSSAYYSFGPLLNPEAYTSNFTTLADGQLIYHVNDGNDGLYKWYNSPLKDDGFNNINVNFKEMTFDVPHNIKRIYQIYVTYRCTGDSGVDMNYSLDGGDNLEEFRKDIIGTGYNKSFNDTQGKWEVASLLFGGPINCYSIQLRIEGQGMPSDFEINDISFVYRVKNVRVNT